VRPSRDVSLFGWVEKSTFNDVEIVAFHDLLEDKLYCEIDVIVVEWSTLQHSDGVSTAWRGVTIIMFRSVSSYIISTQVVQ
jgi:hypothetical protein